MNRVLFTFFIVLIFTNAFGQRINWLEKSDSLNQSRLITTSSFVGSSWIGGTIALSSVWYSDFQKTSFHTFDDSRDWLQMDKIGHVYSSAHLSEASYRLFRWTGLQEKKSAIVGSLLGFGFQTTLEVLDGRNEDWGFSWSDMGANALGSGFFLGQQLLWKEQRFVLKFSTHQTEFAKYRPEVLGTTYSERLLKDYNGQTYWLSFSPKKFTDKWPLPAWACFSFGYSVNEKLVGSSDYFVTNERTFQAKRQLLLSFDIDVRELPIKKKWLKAVLRPFHYIKIPFPTLILENSKIGGQFLYF